MFDGISEIGKACVFILTYYVALSIGGDTKLNGNGKVRLIGAVAICGLIWLHAWRLFPAT